MQARNSGELLYGRGKGELVGTGTSNWSIEELTFLTLQSQSLSLWHVKRPESMCKDAVLCGIRATAVGISAEQKRGLGKHLA